MVRHQDNASERIVDGFEDLLLEVCGPQVTLETVAARVGLTKGGLLYHFGSRSALVAALVARFERRTAADLAEMAAASSGAAISYLRISDYLASPLHRTTLAMGQLSHTETSAAEALARCRDSELALLTTDLGDERLARLTMFVAEGLAREAPSGQRSVGDNAAVLEWYLSQVLPAHAPGGSREPARADEADRPPAGAPA